ncbi:hypothetical protein C8Q70DRAFT_426747 [Cubamyces menziesii]|nr:hypothetical protein C8Q70DRAFT_426747 [Cubamyces menziesii]
MGAQFYEEVIVFTFTRDDVNKADLVRFLVNAQRVKAIVGTFEYYARSPVRSTLLAAPMVYTTLARVLATSPLCPSLCRLHYDRGELTPFSVFRGLYILFSSTLKHFFVSSSEQRGEESRRRRRLSLDELYTQSNPAEDEGTLCDMLAKLRERSPHMQSFYVIVEPSTSAMISATLAAIFDFRQLVTLDYHTVLEGGQYLANPAFIAHCAQLPCLRDLRIEIDDTSWPSDWRLQVAPSQTDASLSFPRLRQFNVVVKTLALLTDLLPYVGFPILEELSVYAVGNIPRDEFHPFFAAVAALPAQHTLRSFHLTATKSVVSSAATSSGCYMHPSPIGAETLEPMLVMSHLQCFVVFLRCPYDIDDTLLRRMALAWPELTKLEFLRNPYHEPNPSQRQCTIDQNCQDDQFGVYRLGGTGVDGGGFDCTVGPPKGVWCRPRATLLGLFYLAQHCAGLGEIALDIDANTAIMPPGRALESSVGRRPCLKMLSLGYSPVEDPDAVAAFLTGLFRIDPSTDIRTLWADDDYHFMNGDPPGAELEDGTGREWWQKPIKYGKGWRTVKRVVRTFEAVRMEERAERRWG